MNCKLLLLYCTVKTWCSCRVIYHKWGTDVRGLTRGSANPPLKVTVTVSLYWSKTRFEDPNKLAVGKSVACNTSTSPSVVCHCWLGDRNGIRPVKKCWFVGGYYLAGAVHVLAPVVAISSVILAAIKSRMETFWCRLSRVVLENGR